MHKGVVRETSTLKGLPTVFNPFRSVHVTVGQAISDLLKLRAYPKTPATLSVL